MSNELQQLLKEYFDRSDYGSIKALAEATDRQVSKSYISHLLRGIRKNPAYDKLVAIARALELNPADSNRLLSAAGYPPLPGQNPDIERAMTALDRLQQTPGISEQAIKTIVDGLVTMIEGVKISVGAGSLPAPRPSRPPAELPLTADEGLIDDLLGEMLASETGHPLENLFVTLKESARQGRWEAKRRLAEALPRLVQSHPDGTLQLAEILRNDYHPDYRADIRRRVIEASPALYGYRPEQARQLFAYREGDEIYTAMATIEALHDMKLAGLMSAADEAGYVQALHYTEPLHQQVAGFLGRVLRMTQTDPDAALGELTAARTHPERIFRIAVQRLAPRLLVARPGPALELLAYFLRRGDDDQPLEHQNLRRPVSRALPDIFTALEQAPELESRVGAMLELLARDPDIHVRRALGDALDRLAAVSRRLAHTVLTIFTRDEDPYIQQRALRTLLNTPDEVLTTENGGQANG